MMIWLIFAILTFLLAAGLLLPFRRQAAGAGVSEAEYDLQVYRDQLAELARDEAAGTIGKAEAEAARAEISRRMLAADARRASASPIAGRMRELAKYSVLLIPLCAIGLYLLEGRPGLPGVPHAARLADAEKNGDFDALIFKVKAYLEKHPDDVRGWQVLVKSLSGRNRYPEAQEAMAGFIKTVQPTADIWADYGEIQVLANGGAMTDKAALSFAEAVKLQPGHPKAVFFQGLALRQQGKNEEAVGMWQKLLDTAPADAPWKPAVAQAIAQAKNPAPAAAPGMPQLSDEQMAAAKDMTPEQRMQMIRSMVDGLDARLQADGKDLDGWLRLARARLMLGEKDKAAKALDDASAVFKDDSAAMGKIAAVRDELGKAQ